MTKTDKILLSLSIVLSVFVLFFVSNYPPKQALGSVSQGSEYIATTTRNQIGTQMTSGQSLTPLTNTSGALGSVVVTGTGTGVINIYDSTTTNAHSDYPTYLLAQIPASIAAGTYTFDARYVHGLVVEIVGTAATSTITYR